MRDTSEVIADAVMGGLLSKQVNRDELVAALRATLPAAEPADAGRDGEPYAWGYTNLVSGDKSITLQRWDRLVEGYAEHPLYARPPSEAVAVDDAMVERYCAAVEDHLGSLSAEQWAADRKASEARADALEAELFARESKEFNETQDALLRAEAAEQSLAEARALLRDEAALLRAWARESRDGGWSTHQVDPMNRRAAAIDALLPKGEGATS